MPAIPIDQQAHAWAGAAIALLLLPYGWPAALAGVALAAAANELRDRQGHGTYAARDFWVTVAGGLAALLVRFVVDHLQVFFNTHT